MRMQGHAQHQPATFVAIGFPSMNDGGFGAVDGCRPMDGLRLTIGGLAAPRSPGCALVRVGGRWCALGVAVRGDWQRACAGRQEDSVAR